MRSRCILKKTKNCVTNTWRPCPKQKNRVRVFFEHVEHARFQILVFQKQFTRQHLSTFHLHSSLKEASNKRFWFITFSTFWRHFAIVDCVGSLRTIIAIDFPNQLTNSCFEFYAWENNVMIFDFSIFFNMHATQLFIVDSNSWKIYFAALSKYQYVCLRIFCLNTLFKYGSLLHRPTHPCSQTSFDRQFCSHWSILL